MADDTILDARQIAHELSRLPGWSGHSDSLTATYALATFPDAIRLVDAVAATAEDLDHHPDIDIRWRRVTFRLRTHSAGGVTGKDLELAGLIDAHARGLGWVPGTD